MDQDAAIPFYPQVYREQVMPSQKLNMSNMAQPNAPVMGQQQPQQLQQIQATLLGPENTVTTCSFCHASIKTAVKYSTNTRTHIAAALWCIACCMCCIPYGSDSAKNADHYCPNCQRYLGTYHK